ncbi:phosphonate C-P lyase system protein PhnG [Ideonella sp. A 288]|uniref:phosphonate C-P lyase system protein PhnG n=1 Tax=Ideonella sp. A 288 TaxID=1962181 RepID=UPI000B4AB7E7|nr:phosphonate C-P lyase system protein PhnG [Ideonella sp. A 288]
MNPTPNPMRRRWLAVLAHAPRDALQRHAERSLPGHAFEPMRPPETGLAMVRGRIGGGGDRFNLGEATLTRCVVRLRTTTGQTTIGVGYRLGRDTERVCWMAQFDALLQQAQHQADLLRAVIEPLQAAIDEARGLQQARTDTSRVRFFTLDPTVAP